MVTAGDIVRLDASAVRASVQVVSLARAADLGRPTPCAAWNAPLTGEIAADLACGGPSADPRFTLAAHGA